jgi:hypothetical protein
MQSTHRLTTEMNKSAFQCFLLRHARSATLYEVLISTTLAMVLLPFDFWFAAELVVLVALPTIYWEVRRGQYSGLCSNSSSRPCTLGDRTAVLAQVKVVASHIQ